ncbi:MAG: transcription antitermination factor NusB [Eubacteriales bacterium]|nr:transcription antitermination factor NusB [Eubacteriales bacterium]
MKRREAREIAFTLIFEIGFGDDSRSLNEVYTLAAECREFEEDEYISQVFFGIKEKLPEIDAKIAAHSVGWKTERLSRVSQAIMRLCIYEMLFREDIPYNIAINEAIELAKKYDDENAPKFINGIVNTVADKEGLKKTE